MSVPKHLNNAPIVEAIIALAIQPPPQFDVKRLSELKQRLGDDYPIATEIHQKQFQISLGQPSSEQPPANASEVHVIGYRITSKNQLYIVQARPDEVIISRLKPYPSWQEFSAEARKILKCYTDIVGPISSVKRIGVRFINQIRLTLPAKFEDYLTAPPRIPEGLPEIVSSFFSQVVIEDVPNKITSTLIQFTQPLTDPAFFNVILDIGAFRQGDFEMDENKIWSVFQTLRDAKNKVFFNSVTEQTLRLHE